MNRLFALLTAAGTSLALTSCTDVVKLDVPPTTPLLAVDGQITDQAKPAVVSLALTQPYFTKDTPPAVTGATLTLDDDQGRRDVLRETTPGRYVGSGAVRGRIGGRYMLTIMADGQTYRAETEIRRTPSIDNLQVEFKKDEAGFDDGYYVLYNGPELPGVGDYYRFRLYANGVLRNKPGDLILTSDELVDGNYIGNVRLNSDPFKRDERVRAEMLAIPRDYYFFLRELQTQATNEGLFATSPANVRTNVRNTQAGAGRPAVGYFAGYTVRADSVVVR
jgi:Domain of unknown function (DUF4249)